MEFSEYRDVVRNLETGKKLPDSVYVHESAFGQLPLELATLALESIDNYKIRDRSWNIIKFYKKDFKLAYLNYPEFPFQYVPICSVARAHRPH